MKAVVFLFVVVFVCLSPALGELAAEEFTVTEGMLNTALMPVMNELRVMKEELAAVKTEFAAMKSEVAAMKKEFVALKREVFDLKLEVRELKGEVRGQEIRITDLREQVSRQANTLTWVAGLLVTVLLAFLGWGFAKWLKDKEKSSEEVAALQAELVALRAENERLKPQIVTERGGAVQRE